MRSFGEASMSTKFLLLMSVLAPAGAQAHHSPAAFDMTREILIEGTIVELEWKNPHVYLTLETRGADGILRTQEAEAAPVGSIQTYGVTREQLEPGSQIMLRANPSRRAGGIVRALSFTAIDGSVRLLDAVGARTVSPPMPTIRATTVASKWVLPPTAFMERVLAPLPLTDAAKAKRVQAMQVPGAEMLCGKETPPPYIGPVLYDINVSDSDVVIREDGYGDASRRISLAETSHPTDLVLSVMGHSIGCWEEGILVVDTAGFSTQVTSRGLPLGPNTRLQERFPLTDDRLHLLYEVRIEDPDNLTEPVNYSMVWDHHPELNPSELECDVEIDGRYMQYR